MVEKAPGLLQKYKYGTAFPIMTHNDSPTPKAAFSTQLPIDDVLPELQRTLGTHSCAVLSAPPGAGKTTRVPLALLNEEWTRGKRILMLEPRRIAARTAARFMAKECGEPVGKTVGYRVHLENKTSRETRIEVVTEGILTRMLQSDPELSGVACVIFDEFHERSIHADLGLALTLETQEVFRDDLKILVMSATLDSAPLQVLLDNCPVLSSQGRSYPVSTQFIPPVRQDARIEDTVSLAVRHALSQEQGSMLVFLPGAREIRQTAERLADLEGPALHIHQLFGALSHKEQDAAIAPAPAGVRKIVLSSAIAESSLTIEGISIVIDSGLARVPRFHPGSGMTRLVTERVSRASADQRRGRAGRLGPGVCYRLWSEHEDRQLKDFAAPEIREADLAPLALELANWGTESPEELRWLDVPPQSNFSQAQSLLQQLGALDAHGHITPHGTALAALPLHPRLAHMLLRGKAEKAASTASLLAACISERDMSRNPDLRHRLAQFQRGAASGRIQESARRLAALAGIKKLSAPHPDAAGILLAYAYPDRIAQRVGPGQFRLSQGRAAWLPEDETLAHEDFLVVADLDGNGVRARIWRAAPVFREELEQAFSEAITEKSCVGWDSKTESVIARQQSTLGKLVLRDAPLKNVSDEDRSQAVLAGIRQIGLHALPWDKDSTNWRERVSFLHALDAPAPSEWPDLSDEALLASLEDWLLPFLTGISRRSQFKKIPLMDALSAMLGWDGNRRLNALAPQRLQLPDGTHARIDYAQESGPALLVKLQKMFGVTETPRIAGGRYALTIHLLSPAQRPLQITRDLKNFWENGYKAVRAEMRGRYPKHKWPEDPTNG
ncbi:ATP-dependent helicase HrpB [Desulfobaculum bizertense]|uniref:ATP-dependent helicase HrpB n=1 Tax=Desulfobaculum bizertense TaxID=376490 RepID=UPI001F443823|nr:ATP-dependent helicase HrpB [Desulfobaculum bizertense]UIJ38225.1 ATP-dependent helicase HrpB [Desulfobaculum bizertense]